MDRQLHLCARLCASKLTSRRRASAAPLPKRPPIPLASGPARPRTCAVPGPHKSLLGGRNAALTARVLWPSPRLACREEVTELEMQRAWLLRARSCRARRAPPPAASSPRPPRLHPHPRLQRRRRASAAAAAAAAARAAPARGHGVAAFHAQADGDCGADLHGARSPLISIDLAGPTPDLAASRPVREVRRHPNGLGLVVSQGKTIDGIEPWSDAQGKLQAHPPLPPPAPPTRLASLHPRASQHTGASLHLLPICYRMCMCAACQVGDKIVSINETPCEGRTLKQVTTSRDLPCISIVPPHDLGLVALEQYSTLRSPPTTSSSCAAEVNGAPHAATPAAAAVVAVAVASPAAASPAPPRPWRARRRCSHGRRNSSTALNSPKPLPTNTNTDSEEGAQTPSRRRTRRTIARGRAADRVGVRLVHRRRSPHITAAAAARGFGVAPATASSSSGQVHTCRLLNSRKRPDDHRSLRCRPLASQNTRGVAGCTRGGGSGGPPPSSSSGPGRHTLASSLSGGVSSQAPNPIRASPSTPQEQGALTFSCVSA